MYGKHIALFCVQSMGKWKKHGGVLIFKNRAKTGPEICSRDFVNVQKKQWNRNKLSDEDPNDSPQKFIDFKPVHHFLPKIKEHVN